MSHPQLFSPLKAGSIDLAWSNAAIQWSRDLRSLFAECYRVLRPGGLLMFDNTLWDGDVADDSIQDEDTVAIRQLNRQLLEDDRISMSLVPIGDGLTLCRKR